MEADCYRGSCRQPVVCGLNSSVAMQLEFLSSTNFTRNFCLLESLFRSPNLTSNGSSLL